MVGVISGMLRAVERLLDFRVVMAVHLLSVGIAGATGQAIQQESQVGPSHVGLVSNAGIVTHSIVIDVPTGPAGIAPKLSLSYVSQNGDGIAGVGWLLARESIQCSSRFGPPDYGACEHYELNGELMVGPYPDADAPGVERYHTLEESFERVRHLLNDTWEVTGRDGTRRLFGVDSLARVVVGQAVAEWHLSSVTDVFGNAIAYEYEQPQAHHGYAYLSEVNFAGGTREVAFEYEPRPDVVQRFDRGRRIQLDMRLSEVIVRAGPSLGIHHRLELGYAVSGTYTVERSRLASATRYGSDCTNTSARPSVLGCAGLPPKRFEYTDTPNGLVAQFIEDSSVSLPTGAVGSALQSSFPNQHGLVHPNNYGVVWGDVNGDGLADLIRADCAVPCAPGGTSGIYQVFLNSPSGWSASPDPAWSASLSGLQYTSKSLKLLRPAYLDAFFSVFADVSAYCIAEESTFETNFFLGSDFEYSIPPRPMSVEDHPDHEAHIREFAAPGNFRAADLNADGRVDFILSARLGGVWKKLAANCVDDIEFQEYVDAEIQVVFLNTGDASTGWERASDLGQPGLEVGLPAFSALEIQDHMVELNCSSRSWGGSYDINFYPSEELNLSVGYCRDFVDYDAQLVELNGDGRLDVMVIEPADKRFLVQNFPVHHTTGEAYPLCSSLVLKEVDSLTSTSYNAAITVPQFSRGSIACYNPGTTRAYLQQETSPGMFEWVSAPEFDLVNAPAAAPDHHSYLTHTYFGWAPFQLLWHPAQKGDGAQTRDVGVRIADVNGDGLTDIIWKDPFLAPSPYASYGPFDMAEMLSRRPFWAHYGGPTVADGVLLNTGAGWCASWLPAPEGCPDAAKYHLPEPLVSAKNALYSAVNYDAGDMPTTGEGASLVDLNGDGLLDFLRLFYSGTAWLQSPGQVGTSLWKPSSNFLPPAESQLSVPLDSDGVMDWIGTHEIAGTGTFYSTSQSRLPDLLARYQNEDGGTVSYSYETPLMQFDSDLEAVAEADAASLVPGASDVFNTTRWHDRPVVTEVRKHALNYFSESPPGGALVSVDRIGTYRYARPRYCDVHRSHHGFRVVESTGADQSRLVTNFHQSHGIVGHRSLEVLYSAIGAPLQQSSSIWELAENVPGTAPGMSVGRLLSTTRTNEYGPATGDDPGASISTTYTYDDGYGYNFEATRVTDRASGGLVLEKTPPASANTAAWVIGEPVVVSERAEDGRLFSHRVFEYHMTSTGTETHFLRKATSTDQPREFSSIQGDASEYVVQYDYDSWGNVTSETVNPDGEALTTSYCYDGDAGCLQGHGSHSMVVKKTDALGNSVQFYPHNVFAVNVGVVSDYVDEPRSVITYDVFGREVGRFTSGEGSSQYFRLSEVHYSDSIPQIVTESKFLDEAESDAIVTVTVLDGFGGIWKSLDRLPDGSEFAYLGRAKAVDPLNRVEYASLKTPCGSDPACSTVTGANSVGRKTITDPLDRIISRIEPDGSTSLAKYEAGLIGGAVGNPYSGRLLDRVSAMNARGEVSAAYADLDRIVRLDECAVMGTPGSLSVPDCGSSADETYFVYDGAGERVAAIDAVASLASTFSTTGPNTLRWSYDTLGRLISAVDPDKSGPEIQEFNSQGRVERVVNARGQAREYEFDGIGRITSVVMPGDEPDVTVVYPSQQMQKSHEFDLARYSNQYFYDELGRLERAETGLRGSMETRYEYDLVGRRTKMTHPILNQQVRTEIGYEYEGPLLRRVCDLESASSCDQASTQYAEQLEYDVYGNLESFGMAGGTRLFEYDTTTRRLTRDRFDAGGAGTYWVDRLMRDEVGTPLYDEVGNLLEVRATSSLGDVEFGAKYTYDRRGRIATWERVGHSAPVAFKYDSLANMVVHGGRAQVYDDPDRPHAIQSREAGAVVYTYDGDGNVATVSNHGLTTYYTFDAVNRLRCVGSNAGSCDKLAVTYDLSGARIKEVANGVIRRFVGQDFQYTDGTQSSRESIISIHIAGKRVATKRVVGGELVSIIPGTEIWIPTPLLRSALLGSLLVGFGLLLVISTSGSGTNWSVARVPAIVLLVVVVQWAHPQAVLAGGGTSAPATVDFRWVISDVRGSGIIEVDESGDRVYHAVFEPYGAMSERIGQSSYATFAGHSHSTSTGFYFMNARWQDPSAGTFVSTDPVVPDVNNPQSYNPYSYARNNPISFIDPTGRNEGPVDGSAWGKVLDLFKKVGASISSALQSLGDLGGTVIAAVGGAIAGGVVAIRTAILGGDGVTEFVSGGVTSVDDPNPAFAGRGYVTAQWTGDLVSDRGGISTSTPDPPPDRLEPPRPRWDPSTEAMASGLNFAALFPVSLTNPVVMSIAAAGHLAAGGAMVIAGGAAVLVGAPMAAGVTAGGVVLLGVGSLMTGGAMYMGARSMMSETSSPGIGIPPVGGP